MNLFEIVRRHPFAALGAALIVAGCGNSSSGPDAAATAAPAAQQTQPAQQAPQTAAAASSGQITVQNCTAASGGAIHLKVGTSELMIPARTILDVVPAGMQPPINKAAVQAELQRQADAGAGCPGKPIDSGLILLQDEPQHPLLDGRIGLLQMSPNGITARFAELTRNLQNNPTRNCQSMGADLMGCLGTENRGGQKTDVMYVITTDPAEKMRTGGPLAARCIIKDKAIQGCNLIEQLSGGLAIDASLRAGSYSTAGLRKALQFATAKVNGLRRR
ncbi:MAG: hypothetical protein AAGJ28_14380 [Pseudomonadota bacterium]